MSDLLQSGNYSPGPHAKSDGFDSHHPDADQLNAFVEHALPEHERLETLAHLADCANCREIVALSVPPLEDAAHVEHGTVVLPHFAASLAASFSGWNAAWIVAPVLAAVVILTIYISHLPAKRPLAGQVAETRPYVAPAPPSSNAGSRSPQTPPTRSNATAKPFIHAAKPKSAAEIHRADNLAVNGRETVPLRPPPLPPAQDHIFRHKAAPAKDSQSIGGPLIFQSSAAGVAPLAGASANLPSKQSANMFNLSRSTAQTTARLPQAIASAAPPAAGPSASIDSASTTVNAQESESSVATVDSEVPDALAGMASTAVARAASRKSTFMAVRAPLPSGLAVTSLAVSLHRRLALDARNQLFFSEDDGHHWKAVPAVWRGRVMAIATTTISAGPLHSLAPPISLAVPERFTRGAVALAQPDTDRATSLGGIVSDQSGAAVPGATIVATDSRTAFVRSVQTDVAGHYLVEELPPGVYQLEAQAPGFQMQSQIAVVSSAQQAVKNLVLAVGQSSQTVMVTTSSAQLQTSSRSMALANPKAHTAPSAPLVNGSSPVFVITTDSGGRWISPDGMTWKRE